MKGRFLVDVHHLGHKAGDYADIDKAQANALVDASAFDIQAPWPSDASGEEQPKTRRKPAKQETAQ